MFPDPLHCILLVDDDPDAPFFVRRGLIAAGIVNSLIPVFSAEDAQSFLERAASTTGGVDRPLATLLNVNMPGMDGFDLLRWIRSIPKLDRMAVIMGSDSDDPADVARAATLGAQAYVRKHVDIASGAQLLVDAAAFAQGVKDPELFRIPTNLIFTDPWGAVRECSRPSR